MPDDPSSSSSSRFAHRKSDFKSTPSAGLHRERRVTQVSESQRRRRDEAITTLRLSSITSLSGLKLALGGDDDEDSDEGQGNEEEPERRRGVVSGMASFMEGMEQEEPAEAGPSQPQPKKTGGRAGKRRGATANTPLSNVLTYTTLLPLPDPLPSHYVASDGLPSTSELTSNWLALTPIPKGKRCLCVSGTYGSPTSLHTRVSARVMIRWISQLPGETVLDCFLDEDWKDNGVLHVLDCLRWRGVDIASNPASFRLFFLLSRLSELPPPTPPSHDSSSTSSPGQRYSHPTVFRPVPYHAPPIDLPQWRALVTSSGEMLLLEADGEYVFGDESELAEEEEVRSGWVGEPAKFVAAMERRLAGEESGELLTGGAMPE